MAKPNVLDKIINKLKFLPEYVRVMSEQAAKRLPPNDRQIVLTLDDPRLYSDYDGSGRHAYLTLNAFNDAGYNVYLYKKMDFLSYTRLGKYGRYLFGLERVRVLPTLPVDTRNMIYAFDTVYPEALDRPWKRKTYINILKSPSVKMGEVVPIPFSLHPIWYQSKGYLKINELRPSRRTLRILFGGNTLTSYYSSPKFKNYGLLTRAEGLEAAFSLTDRVKTIESKEELNAIFDGTNYLNACRVLRTDDKSVGVEDRWLELTAKSDFFLCLSGTDVPMCHNAIESMAVGTIPIIGYHEWFTPALEHMKNAVIYTTKEDLVAKLRQVFAMNSDEIERLRRGVLEFYDTHLGGRNFVRRYEQQTDPVNTIMLYPKFIPTDWENKESEKIRKALHDYFGEKAGS
jgi:hypothetical protein